MQDLIDDLLARKTDEQRLDRLRRAGLLDQHGLELLLDAAGELIDRDPAVAGRLAELCGAAATAVDAADVLPRAQYLHAEARAIDGDFPVALELVELARRGWAALGKDVEAERTGLVRMWALNELGRHAEALETGENLLTALNDLAGDQPAPELVRLRAIARQNIGICLSFTGQYQSALVAYDAAERDYRAIGLVAEVAELQHNRGMELLNLGRATDAVRAFEAAAGSFRAAGQTLFHGRCLYELGRARLLLGHYVTGLDAFREAGALLERLEARVDHDRLLVATAEAYLSAQPVRRGTGHVPGRGGLAARRGHGARPGSGALGHGRGTHGRRPSAGGRGDVDRGRAAVGGGPQRPTAHRCAAGARRRARPSR